MQLNPFHPNRFWSHLGRACFVAREYQEAISAFQNVKSLDSRQLAYLSACYAYSGDAEKARQNVSKAIALDVSLTAEIHVGEQHFVGENDQQHLLEGLRQAGFQ
jgi:adenylate cyclase